MTTQTPQQSSGGVGLGGLVFIVFLVLKLTDTIDWSWWWVTAPLWGPFGLILVGLLLIGLPLMIRADKHAAKSWNLNTRRPR
jgi:hypothetical protein